MERSTWLWILIVCALIVHIPFIAQRIELERNNDVVELTVDGGGLLAVAADADLSPAELFERWRRLGVTSVSITDDFAAGFVGSLPPGTRVVPRTTGAMAAAATARWDQGPFVPAGDELEGYPATGGVVQAVGEQRIPFGIVEFAGTAGVPEAVRLLNYDAVFVHSIPARELVHLTEGQAIARFHRALFERQARLLYIHPLIDSAHRPSGDVHLLPDDVDSGVLSRNDRYIEAIVDLVARADLHTGPVAGLPRWTTPVVVPISAIVAALAAALLLGRRWGRVTLPIAVELGVLLAGGLGVAALAVLGYAELARQGAALAVAVVLPALALVQGGAVVDVIDRSSAERPSAVETAAKVLAGLFVVLGITAVGAVLIAGALGDSGFLLKLSTFRGVKLAHVVPFTLVAAVWWLGRGNTLRLASFRIRWRWQYAALGVLILGFGFILVARTGHDLLPVSEAERAVREWLETTLPVRPRTKEFLFGYPALLLGLLLAASRRRTAARPLLLLGTLVPVSIVNTFAHPHIGFGVSAVRTGYGLLVGAVVALFVGAGLFLFLKNDGAGRAIGPAGESVQADERP